MHSAPTMWPCTERYHHPLPPLHCGDVLKDTTIHCPPMTSCQVAVYLGIPLPIPLQYGNVLQDTTAYSPV